MSIDHGELNAPLHKRINIDREIDRHKAGIRRDAKAAAKVHRERQQRARELVLAATDERVGKIAAKAGKTVKQARKSMLSMARFTPEIVIAALGNEGRP
jgi:predicted RNA-binding protein YlqC (UPF0109 family)